MTVRITNAELRRLAEIGARARLEKLQAERAALLRSFPGLRRRPNRSASK